VWRIGDLVFPLARKVLPGIARRRAGYIVDRVGDVKVSVDRIVERRIGYWGYHVLSSGDGNDLIGRLLQSGEPTAIGKLGVVETRALRSFIENRGKEVVWDTATTLALYRNAGVFPPDDKVLRRWCVEFLDSVQSIDLMGLYFFRNESKIVRKFAPNAKVAEARALDPWYHREPWSRYLQKKRVLVIHPFEQSIRRQFVHRDKIWQDERILPIFELDTVKVPLSDALVKSGFEDWFAALHHIMARISEKEFDVAIVGAGAYSIPLVAHIKARGKFAIHLGGGTQILFGIKGKRWDNHEIGLRFYNDYWARPLEEETPPNVGIVEDGCYW